MDVRYPGLFVYLVLGTPEVRRLVLGTAHLTCCCTCSVGPNGTFREVRPAAIMDYPVTVLTYSQVLDRYPHLMRSEALDAYQAEFADEVESDSGMLGCFFWVRGGVHVYEKGAVPTPDTFRGT